MATVPRSRPTASPPSAQRLAVRRPTHQLRKRCVLGVDRLQQLLAQRREHVQAITVGRGVDVAYDSVGKDTFMGSMACLARLGHLVNSGQSSGPVEPIPMSLLFQKSNSVTRPNLFHYIADRPRRDEMAAALFQALAEGILTPGETHDYPFEEVGRAQRDMEERNTAGAVILTL